MDKLKPKPKREMYFKIRGKSFIIRCRGRTYSTSVGHVKKLIQERLKFLYIERRRKNRRHRLEHKPGILGYNRKEGLD